MSEELKPCPMCGREIELYFNVRESDHPNDDDVVTARPSCPCPLLLEESAGYGERDEQENARLRLIEYWNELSRAIEPTTKDAMTYTAAFLCGLSLGAALTGANAARSAALAKATRNMRDRQRAYFKHRGDVLLAEAKAAETDVDRLLAEIFPVLKQEQLV